MHECGLYRKQLWLQVKLLVIVHCRIKNVSGEEPKQRKSSKFFVQSKLFPKSYSCSFFSGTKRQPIRPRKRSSYRKLILPFCKLKQEAGLIRNAQLGLPWNFALITSHWATCRHNYLVMKARVTNYQLMICFQLALKAINESTNGKDQSRQSTPTLLDSQNEGTCH